MAVKHAASMGRSIVTFAVISVISTIPVSGAPDHARKECGHPNNGETHG